MSKKILEVKDLKIRFITDLGTVYAVNGISFDLYEGKTLGVIGESGCGKTVSMLSITRLLSEPPAKVRADYIKFKGKEIQNASEKDMNKIRGSQVGLIFQDPMMSLNPILKVGFQIMEPLRNHMNMGKKEARERAYELLCLVGIPEARKRFEGYPHQFSGGMQQRAIIAMALACNPSLLIADEPTTALDVTIQAQIVDLVKRLRDQFGMALIWITHDFGLLAGLADRINVMYSGYIIEKGIADDIYENALHPYTRALLQSIPRIEGKLGEPLKTIEGFPPELYNPPNGCPFAPRCEFVKDICKQENPPLIEYESGHKAACWVEIKTGELR